MWLRHRIASCHVRAAEVTEQGVEAGHVECAWWSVEARQKQVQVTTVHVTVPIDITVGCYKSVISLTPAEPEV